MSFIGWIIVGLIAGSVAKAILADRASGGWLNSLLLGVIGAVVGGWLGSIIFDTDLGSIWNLRTWVLAIAGSVVVLWLWSAITGRKSAG